MGLTPEHHHTFFVSTGNFSHKPLLPEQATRMMRRCPRRLYVWNRLVLLLVFLAMAAWPGRGAKKDADYYKVCCVTLILTSCFLSCRTFIRKSVALVRRAHLASYLCYEFIVCVCHRRSVTGCHPTSLIALFFMTVRAGTSDSMFAAKRQRALQYLSGVRLRYAKWLHFDPAQVRTVYNNSSTRSSSIKYQ